MFGGPDMPGHVSQARNSAEALFEIWSVISSREQTKRGDEDAGYLLDFAALPGQQVEAIVSHVQNCQTASRSLLGLDSFVIHPGGVQAEQSVIIRSLQSQQARVETEELQLVDDETVISQTQSW